MSIHKPIYPFIIRVAYKYGDEEARDSASLKVLKSNMEIGYYPEVDKPGATFNEYFEDVCGMTIDELHALPETVTEVIGYPAKTIESQLARAYHYCIKDWNEWNAIDTAIKNNNGKLACKILTRRADFEYEGFYAEAIESNN